MSDTQASTNTAVTQKAPTTTAAFDDDDDDDFFFTRRTESVFSIPSRAESLDIPEPVTVTTDKTGTAKKKGPKANEVSKSLYLQHYLPCVSAFLSLLPPMHCLVLASCSQSVMQTSTLWTAITFIDDITLTTLYFNNFRCIPSIIACFHDPNDIVRSSNKIKP